MGATVYPKHSKEATPPALIYTEENVNTAHARTHAHTHKSGLHEWQMTAKYDLLISICNQIDFAEELAPKWEGKYCVALDCMENTFHNFAISTEQQI